MENLDDSSVLPPVQKDLEWTYEAQQNLYDLAYWARFFSIIAMVMAGIQMLVQLYQISVISKMQFQNWLTFLSLGLSIYAATQLFAFANSISYGVDNNSDDAMCEAFKKLILYWIINIALSILQLYLVVSALMVGFSQIIKLF